MDLADEVLRSVEEVSFMVSGVIVEVVASRVDLFLALFVVRLGIACIHYVPKAYEAEPNADGDNIGVLWN